MSRGRVTAAGAAVGGLLLIATACTTTTGGIGSPGPLGGFTGSAPGGTVNPGGPNVPAPSGNARPPGCRPTSCRQRLSASLAGTYTVSVWQEEGARSTIVEMTGGGGPASYSVLVGEAPVQLDCETRGTQGNCVLVDVRGPGSVARVIRVVGGGLALGASVAASTST